MRSIEEICRAAIVKRMWRIVVSQDSLWEQIQRNVADSLIWREIIDCKDAIFKHFDQQPNLEWQWHNGQTTFKPTRY